MKPVKFLSLVTLLVFAMTSMVYAEASLWLFPDSSIDLALTDQYDTDPAYVGEDENPWFTESYVVGSGPFTLDVYNHGRGSGDNTAYGVKLIIAVNEASLVTAGTIGSTTITSSSFTFGMPSYSCSGRDVPRHGVLPTWHTEIPVGDIDQNEYAQVAIDIAGDPDNLLVHFDAYGEGMRTKKKGKTTTTSCYDVFNPFSHDVTQTGGGVAPPPACTYALSVSKAADLTDVQAGGLVTYTINYANAGDCDLTGVVVTDTLPTITIAGVTLPALNVTSTTPPATSQTDTSLTWDIGSLAVGGSGSITVTAIVSPLVAGGTVITNVVCVDASEADQACDAVDVTVTSPPPVNDAGEDIGTPGFWCNQTKRALDCSDTPDAHCKPSQKFTYNQANGWLTTIQIFSRVFEELGRATTLGDANVLLCDPQQEANPKLQRHLLTVWFNLVSNQVYAGSTLADLCPGPAALPAGADSSWTVAYVIVSAESALLGGADDATLLFWKDIIDFIDNAQIPPFC